MSRYCAIIGVVFAPDFDCASFDFDRRGADFAIKLRRPTPINNPLDITSEVVELLDDRVKVEIQLHDGDKLCASGEGLFVAVKEGHPAYHRWS